MVRYVSTWSTYDLTWRLIWLSSSICYWSLLRSFVASTTTCMRFTYYRLERTEGYALARQSPYPFPYMSRLSSVIQQIGCAYLKYQSSSYHRMLSPLLFYSYFPLPLTKNEAPESYWMRVLVDRNQIHRIDALWTMASNLVVIGEDISTTNPRLPILLDILELYCHISRRYLPIQSKPYD
jgi:hypothetical protein